MFSLIVWLMIIVAQKEHLDKHFHPQIAEILVGKSSPQPDLIELTRCKFISEYLKIQINN